ncbi:MAG: orotate phosphoribosyltransferase [archaeon]
MEKYKEDFIKFLIESKALAFGEFTLKSGRKSPYFINTGMFDSGEKIAKLGFYYANKITKEFSKKDYDIIYGPAYKGIPLALTTAISLAKDFGIDKGYSFNRKEEKEHGDKGAVVGAKIKEGAKIIILDDVFTTGETKEETIELLNSIGKIEYVCVLIAVDRKEVGVEGSSAIKEFEKKHGIPVKSVVNIREIIEFLHNKEINGKVYVNDEVKKEMEAYLEKYGVKE